MSLETELATRLHERLTEIEQGALATLPNGLRAEQYNQSCGFIEAIRQVRDTLLPEIVQDLQRK